MSTFRGSKLGGIGLGVMGFAWAKASPLQSAIKAVPSWEITAAVRTKGNGSCVMQRLTEWFQTHPGAKATSETHGKTFHITPFLFPQFNKQRIWQYSISPSTSRDARACQQDRAGSISGHGARKPGTWHWPKVTSTARGSISTSRSSVARYSQSTRASPSGNGWQRTWQQEVSGTQMRSSQSHATARRETSYSRVPMTA